ncbi:MAG: type II toxin-antitoxin system RelE/ParE family toxin [Dehalococcoidia bacterium]
MIRSFACKETEKIFNRNASAKLPASIQKTALRRLFVLHSAPKLGDLAGNPGNHLEELHGDRKGQHSIRINDRWRLCFIWDGTDARKVEIVDYH